MLVRFCKFFNEYADLSNQVISEGSYPIIYLGVPLFTGSPKKALLQPMVDKILAKFSNWIGKSLSMAGRVCLVKSVILSSLTHSMMVYKWPIYLVHKLEITWSINWRLL